MTGARTKLWLGIVGLLLLSGATSCVSRALIWPTHMDATPQEHIYFVEQESDKDSRIKKCDILPDNSVKCAVQFDLE